MFYCTCIFIGHLFKPVIEMIEKPAYQFEGLSVRDGFKRSEQRAGVKDKAMKAERTTEMAMVMANCWYNVLLFPV